MNIRSSESEKLSGCEKNENFEVWMKISSMVLLPLFDDVKFGTLMESEQCSASV